MTLDVDKEIAALRRLTMRELRARFAAVFGETPAGNRLWLNCHACARSSRGCALKVSNRWPTCSAYKAPTRSSIK
jgi:hypothetical protein